MLTGNGLRLRVINMNTTQTDGTRIARKSSMSIPALVETLKPLVPETDGLNKRAAALYTIAMQTRLAQFSR